MTETLPVVTLENLNDGAALQLFQRELDQVLRNIADENTDARAARRITLEFVFKPDEDREMGSVEIKAGSKLPGVKPAKTHVYFGRDHGQHVAREYDPKQRGLFEQSRVVQPIASAGPADRTE